MTFTQTVDNYKTFVIWMLCKQLDEVFIALRGCKQWHNLLHSCTNTKECHYSNENYVTNAITFILHHQQSLYELDVYIVSADVHTVRNCQRNWKYNCRTARDVIGYKFLHPLNNELNFSGEQTATDLPGKVYGSSALAAAISSSDS